MLIPRDYQSHGSAWLACRKAAILGDAVGLGKTLTVLLAVQLLGAKRVLIISPLSHKRFWQDEITRVLADGSTIEFTISHYEQYRSLRVGKATDRKLPSEITAQLIKPKYDVVIRDEAHRGHRNSQQFKWMNQIKAAYRWAVTGSPIAERPDDLWQILYWCDRKEFRSYWAFVSEFQDIDTGYGKGREYAKVGSIKPTFDPQENKLSREYTLKHLQRRVANYLLVRKREDVGLQLPPFQVSDQPLDMGEAQAKWYSRVQQETFIGLEAEFGPADMWNLTPSNQLIIRNGGARYIRLCQSTSDATTFEVYQSKESIKLDWLKNYAETESPPAVIMTRFVYTADSIKEMFAKMGRVGDIIGTFKSLAESHNFQYDYHILIAVDAPDGRLTWEQARGRIERMGQEHNMIAYRLRCAGSVDDHSWQLIDEKQEENEIVLSYLRGLKDAKQR